MEVGGQSYAPAALPLRMTHFIGSWVDLQGPAFIPPAAFEPATPASDTPQTLDLGRSATGIGLDPRTAQP
jgi:hypothetical protein